MSEIIKQRLKENSVVIIYKTNNFRYKGKVLAIDSEFVCMFDFKDNKERFINIKDISDVEVLE